MRVLLCTNGSPHTVRALQTGSRVAQATAATVDILVVLKDGQEEQAALPAQAVASDLEAIGVPVTLLHRSGRLAEEVVRQARAAPYDLVVIGSRGRRGLVRLILGSVALHVTEHVPASVLVVKGRVGELKKLLVCSAAGPASELTTRFASHLARALGASVTLLHVMSQLPLAEEAVLEDLEASAAALIQRGSREGVHLAQMLALLEAEGVAGRAIVRHGLVLDEILEEGREGDYDLLVTGAHITPGLNAWLVDDLSADILLAADRPVLVVRQLPAKLEPQPAQNQVG